jgi:hypothetical protein
LTLLTDDWVPYADVKLAVDGKDRAWVAFEDRRAESGERVMLTRIDSHGTPSPPQSWPGEAPDIAAQADSVTLLWTTPNGALQALEVAPENSDGDEESGSFGPRIARIESNGIRDAP